jgi:hypothetical protein
MAILSSIGTGQTKLFKVQQHVRRIGEDAKSARALQLLRPVTARQETDAQSAFASRRKQVPDTIADHDAIVNRYFQGLRCSDENIRGWLGIFDVISGHDRRSRGKSQLFQEKQRVLPVAGGCDGDTNSRAVKMLEQPGSAGQRFQGRDHAGKPFIVALFQVSESHAATFRGYFPQQFSQEGFSAHSDAAMNLPCWNRDALIPERLLPSLNMLVHAVDECAVQIKKHSRQFAGFRVRPRFAF